MMTTRLRVREGARWQGVVSVEWCWLKLRLLFVRSSEESLALAVTIEGKERGTIVTRTTNVTRGCVVDGCGREAR